MMTDREKLVGLVKEICNTVVKACGCSDMLPTYSFCKNAVYESIADYLVTNGVTVQEWISVEDRLPEKIPVLCLDQIGKMSVMRFEYDRLVGRCWFDEYEHLINFDWVTHWIPLPEPAKKEET